MPVKLSKATTGLQRRKIVLPLASFPFQRNGKIQQVLPFCFMNKSKQLENNLMTLVPPLGEKSSHPVLIINCLS